MGNRKILYQAKTKYNDILVAREDNIVTLYSPPSVRQTAIDALNPTLCHLEYARNILAGLTLTENPETFLIMGLGGGAIPMMLRNINKLISIDIVEIDPAISQVAKKFFHFKATKKIRLFIDDAFQYLKSSEKKYNIIILDAYIGQEMPKSMLTSDFFKETREHLSDKGVLIANLMSTDKPFLRKNLKTIGSVFRDIWVLNSLNIGNTIAFAMNRRVTKIEIAYRALLLKNDFPENIPLIKLIRRIKKI